MLKELNPISYEFKRTLEHNNIRGCAMTLEFSNLGKTIKTEAKFTSGDINTSLIAIQLLNGGSPIVLDESSVVYANIVRADGTLVTNKVVVIDGSIGAVALHLNQLATEVVGTAVVDITVRHLENKKIVSPKFSFRVFETNDNLYETPDDTEVNVIDVLVDEVVMLKNNIIATNNSIEIDSQERKLIEAEYDAKEAERRQAEIERQLTISGVEEAEAIRNSQEEERQKSMEYISKEFTNKISVTDNKLQLIDDKLSEFSDNELTRQAQHSDRVEEFDKVIKVEHENILAIEEHRASVERDRVIAEKARQNFFEESKVKSVLWEEQELTRQEQETSRVNSHKNMVSTFDSKVRLSEEKISEISQKISEASQKITRFSEDENTRKNEHTARVNQFDNEIKIKHQEMVSAEASRKIKEEERVSAESVRKTFYAQVNKAESDRVTADLSREQRVKTLEGRIDSKITEYNTATLITNSEIDTIIANALK